MNQVYRALHMPPDRLFKKLTGQKEIYTIALRPIPPEAPLPALREGDARTVRGARVKGEKTKPPKEHTDASLLLQMER